MPVIPTNKKLGKRHDKDNYITPDGVAKTHCLQIEKLMEFMGWEIPRPEAVLDVGCGTGVYGWAVKYVFGFDIYVVGFDIRSYNEIKTDNDPNLDRNMACYDHIYWSTPNYPDGLGHFDLIVGNPPFDVAEKLIRDGMKYLSYDSILSFLLRSNYLESKKRYNGLFLDHPLYKYDFLINRIPWANHVQGAKGKTDYETYAFYHWTNFKNETHPKEQFGGFYSELVRWDDN